MIRTMLFLACALLAVASNGHSQTGDKKKSDAHEVEVTFANGSVVRMALVPEKLEIKTQYGTLSVPVRDIRRIDFGLHLPDGADKKIETALKQLASAEYKERDGAVRELVALGAYAYPSLLREAKSADPEVAKRVKDALAKIRAKVPAKDLQLSDDDKITTPRFIIVGRIVPESLKARSEDFGDLVLALSRLRHLRVLADARETEVVIDAAKHSQNWLDTGLMLDGSGTLVIHASGEVELRPSMPGNYVCGPRGYTRTGLVAGGFAPAKAKKIGGDGGLPGRTYPGTLLGRVGENGDPFVIGDRFEGMLDRDGKLYLHIMSSPYEANSSGSYHVKVLVRE